MNTKTIFPPAVGGFAHGLAITAYHQMIRWGTNDEWELDDWDSDGSYDYNIYKPWGVPRISIDVYPLEEDKAGFMSPVTSEMFTIIQVTRNEHGVYTWTNYHNNFNIKENN